MFMHILANRIIVSDSVEAAMSKVDRGNYSSYNPYYDSPQSIGKLTSNIYHCLPSIVDTPLTDAIF